jgi:hypothetical protein
MDRAITFGNLPPEIRLEVQHFLPPSLSWDRESRAMAEEVFKKWATGRDHEVTVRWLRRWFGQSFVQSYEFMTRRMFTFDWVVPKDELGLVQSGRRWEKIFHNRIYSSFGNFYLTTTPLTSGLRATTYLRINQATGKVFAKYANINKMVPWGAEAREFEVRQNSCLTIWVIWVKDRWYLQFAATHHVALSPRCKIRAQDLWTALTSWPFVKFGDRWQLFDARG